MGGEKVRCVLPVSLGINSSDPSQHQPFLEPQGCSSSWALATLAPPLVPEGLGTVLCPLLLVSTCVAISVPLLNLKHTSTACPFVKVLSVKPLLVGVSRQNPASRISWFFL